MFFSSQIYCIFTFPCDFSRNIFDGERVKTGRRVIQANHTAVAQQYAKNGCPSGLRGQIWAQILAVNISDTVSLVCAFLQSIDCLFIHNLSSIVCVSDCFETLFFLSCYLLIFVLVTETYTISMLLDV